MNWWYVVVAALILIPFGIYLSATAGRLDRLHHRVDMAYLALDNMLLRRSSVAYELAESGLIDPASAIVLADAAMAVQDEGGPPLSRGQLESDLTKAIEATVGSREDVEALCQSGAGRDLVDALSGAMHKASIARRFYNDAVRACVDVRRQRIVRAFHLEGKTDLPRPMEMEDSIPPGFQGR